MSSVNFLLRRISGIIPSLAETVLARHFQKDHLIDALREHSRNRARTVVVEVAASDPPIQEYALPAEYSDDDSVSKIESPYDSDVAPEPLLEKDVEYRVVKTSTVYKIFFPGKLAEKFRITYTLPWTEATLGLLPAADEPMVAYLCAHYLALSLAAEAAAAVRGTGDAPADLVDAGGATTNWISLAKSFSDRYEEMVRGTDMNPRGVVAKSSMAATRREGFPMRRWMPRGQVWRRGGG